MGNGTALHIRFSKMRHRTSLFFAIKILVKIDKFLKMLMEFDIIIGGAVHS